MTAPALDPGAEKYTARSGHIYLSGTQALVRLMLVQRWRDEACGLKTAGFVSGYRGSPLGGLDEALWSAADHLARADVKFLPGINEELSATAVWGTQQVHLTGESRADGVFAMWYGKAPGVDRCGDVFKHMSHAGTSRHGGVLLVAGDDHGAYSSTLPNQSDHQFMAAMIPTLYPCNVQQYLELGLHAFAMSRFSGLPVGFKALADTVESSATVDADALRLKIHVPDEFSLPEGGLHARLSSDTLGVQARKQEVLMHGHKIHAAIAYARANRLNRTSFESPGARFGIAASGKSYGDVLEALAELGIDETTAADAGIRVFQISMPWPLEPESAARFAKGLQEILVVEEKRPVVETQFKELLYDWRDDARPRVIGKGHAQTGAAVSPGLPALTVNADFSVGQIVRVIAERIRHFHDSEAIRARLALLDAKDAQAAACKAPAPRPAWYCAGCPHNRSTKVPEGSLALAGIGCHVMATAIFPEHNKTTTHMGGEGAPWLGQAWFSRRDHVFANLGDGTYFHSGSLAIRAAVAAGVNITYKILYNDAVAMTGGQPVDGPLSIPAMVEQLAAEGVRSIALVSEHPSAWKDRSRWAPRRPGLQLTVHERDELETVQRGLRETKGVSVLIYDQVCAAEKRRRRKKKELAPASKHVFINEQVCEGCGDCGMASNCVAILPLPTERGIKRQIDQNACNNDLSCVDGFCPSFVTIVGVKPRRNRVTALPIPAAAPTLPEPHTTLLNGVHNILITGIGGTGVITIGAIIGMAAHLERKAVSVLDMTGMSQKNGAVTSHVRLAADPARLHAQRIPTGQADLVLGCDMLTAASADAISRMHGGRTHAVVNTFEQPSGQFAQDPDWQFPAPQLRSMLEDATSGRAMFLDATALATALTGDAIAANLLMLGFAFQQGHIPLSSHALTNAIRANGVGIERSLQAFAWGRRAAIDMAAVVRAATPARPIAFARPPGLADRTGDNVSYLTAYQSPAYADQYKTFLDRVRAMAQGPHAAQFTSAVAANLFKLMAYKDEYEVARLHTGPQFHRQIEQQFEGTPVLQFHFAAPWIARRDARGRPAKRSFGPWFQVILMVLAKARFLRGTALDPFGYTAHRRAERALIADYRLIVDETLSRWQRVDAATALEIARLPERIRGFGHVKDASIATVRARWATLAGGGAQHASGRHQLTSSPPKQAPV